MAARRRRRGDAAGAGLAVYDLGMEDESDEDEEGSEASEDEVEVADTETSEDESEDESEASGDAASGGGDSDVAGNSSEEETDLPAAWGRSKSQYFGGDTADLEIGQEFDEAKEEEEIAMEMLRSRRHAEDEADYLLDAPAKPATREESSELLPSTAQSQALSTGKLTEAQKRKRLLGEAPELAGLLDELSAALRGYSGLADCATIAHQNPAVTEPGLAYLEVRRHLMLAYAISMNYYLLLKAEGRKVEDHPVLPHILKVKRALAKLEPVDVAAASDMRVIAHLAAAQGEEDESDGSTDGIDIHDGDQPDREEDSVDDEGEVDSGRGKPDLPEDVMDGDHSAFYDEMAAARDFKLRKRKARYAVEPVVPKPGQDALAPGAKRAASYQIMKNRGLTAPKPKLSRNPRAKKREQYRKAVIRRKGQVRDIRDAAESVYYGGEETGIRANLSRSRAIKN